jgi:hypothetical protein
MVRYRRSKRVFTVHGIQHEIFLTAVITILYSDKHVKSFTPAGTSPGISDRT